MIRNFWEKWKALAEKIGDFQFGLIFSLLYFIFVVPFGIVANLFGDFLALRGFPAWSKMEDNSSTKTKLKEQ